MAHRLVQLFCLSTLFCFCLPIMAAERGNVLALMLLPPIAGKGEPQLAISWNGEVAGELELQMETADGKPQRLKTRALTPGMHLESLPLDRRDKSLRAVLRNSAGVELARAELAAKPTMVSSTTTTDWNSTFINNDGPDGIVTAITVYDDGTGPALVAGGSFKMAGGQLVNGLARWNGQSWSPMGTRVSGIIKSLTVYNGQLIAGGAFSADGGITVNGIARWEGTNWSALGAGINGEVATLAIYQGELIAGGSFSTGTGAPGNRIARWNGTNWLPLGAGTSGPVLALAVHQGELIVGGAFQIVVGANAVRNIARWNGIAWAAYAAELTWANVGAIRVDALAEHHGEIIASASALDLNQIRKSRIFRWSGSAWTQLGEEMFSVVNALITYDGELIAGGGIGATRWNGRSWSSMGAMFNGGPSAFAVFGGVLFAGGSFTDAQGAAKNIASWNGSFWSGMGSRIHKQVSALALYNNELVVAGQFFLTDGKAADRIARWDGSTWSTLGTGLEGTPMLLGKVSAMTLFDGELVAGGDFTMIGGISANNIARWNGSVWSALSSGIQATGAAGTVTDLFVHDGQLIVSGEFVTAGGQAANNIARWNGRSWAGLGTGMNAPVRALASYGGELVAGGNFTMAGNQGINAIARWNGTAWSTVGAGVDGQVNALVVFNGELIASVTGSQGSRIARWNGSAWSTLGTLVYPVNTFVVQANTLIAGGYKVSRWDGSTWTTLGIDSNFPNTILALAVYRDQLIAGGQFLQAGNINSPYIAAYGQSQLSTMELIGTTSASSFMGEPVRITVWVTADTAPTGGHVTITGTPGGSCTDLSLIPINASTSEAQCSITWKTAGIRALNATYVGGSAAGTTWEPSNAASILHTVRPRFADGFESP